MPSWLQDGASWAKMMSPTWAHVEPRCIQVFHRMPGIELSLPFSQIRLAYTGSNLTKNRYHVIYSPAPSLGKVQQCWFVFVLALWFVTRKSLEWRLDGALVSPSCRLVLRCIALCWSVLLCVALHCFVLLRAASHCFVLLCIALYYVALRYVG